MNDQDIIRKAVKLADGWKIDEIDWINCYLDGQLEWAQPLDDLTQPTLDALAAQLVRQVDALDDEVFAFVTRLGESVMYIWDSSSENDNRIAVLGPDRTMNTLRAIVESKVLK